MKFKYWGKALCWPIATVAVYGIFRVFIYTQIAIPLWSHLAISEGEWLDVAMIITSLLLIYVGLMVGSKRYSSTHWGMYLSVLCLLFLFGIDNYQTPYLSFMGILPCWVLAVCSFTIGIVIYWIHMLSCSRKSRKNGTPDSNICLLTDVPQNHITDDRLAFEPLAKRIAQSIVKEKVANSFSIGITGPWGTGKTSLLNFIKEYLENNNDVVLIDFSPRQSASISDIQKDFMTELGEALSKHHSGTLRLTRRYTYAIGVIPDKLWPLNFIFGISQSGPSGLKDQIKRIITTTGIRIVVMIDDFDRLSGEEIKEVFKLIDKNASFPNTFFITAYDKERTNKILGDYWGEDKGVDYTDKYFTLEVPLPIRQSIRYLNIMYDYMKGLVKNKTLSCTQDVIDVTMSRINYFIPTYLPTLRDIKRFVNLIAISLPPVENEVLLDEFVLVSLIRYRYPNEYMALCQWKYTETNSINKNEIYLKPGIEKKSPSFESPASLPILKLLFNAELGQYKSISKTNSFNFYFYDIDSGHLRYEELGSLLDSNITLADFRRIVAPWQNNDQQTSDFIEFILSQEKHINNAADAKHYMKIFLMSRTCCESRNLYWNTLSYFRSDNAWNNAKNFGINSVDSYTGFMKDVLRNIFDWSICIETIHDLLHAATNINSHETLSLIISTDELITIATDRLKQVCAQYIARNATHEDVHRGLSACVVEYIYGYGETISKEAIELVKSEIKDNPELYLTSVLSHKKYDNNRIQFTLHEKNVFNLLFHNFDDFNKFINGIKCRNNKLLDCWSDYIESCKAQGTWEPLLTVNGDISQIRPYDYTMYYHLFEGEPIGA